MNNIDSENIKNIIKSNKYFDISIVERLLKQIEQDSKFTMQIRSLAKKSRLNLYT
jgi:hypothetical protein